MKTNNNLKPQDIVVLLKISAINTNDWQQQTLADSLKMSQSEVSQAIARLKYCGLLDRAGKAVMRLSFMEFLQYGLAYTFPQKPGAIVRGIPTAHSAAPLNTIIQSSGNYVWPYGKGKSKGESISPLYPSVVEAAGLDENLYQLLALCDAIRVGRAREKELAIQELKKRILGGE